MAASERVAGWWERSQKAFDATVVVVADVLIARAVVGAALGLADAVAARIDIRPAEAVGLTRAGAIWRLVASAPLIRPERAPDAPRAGAASGR